MDSIHDIDMDHIGGLIGVPFEYGGRGPNSFDCYGLVKHIYEHHGLQLPDYTSPRDGAKITAMMNNEIVLWEECDMKPGCTLLFRVPGNMHVGFYIGNWFVHTWEGSGGVTRERLKPDWHRRLIGSYKYVG